MHVLNAMFIPGYAGTERAFIDYTWALLARGHTVTAMLHRDAPFIDELRRPGVTVVKAPWGDGPATYHPFQSLVYEALIDELAPDVVLAHSEADMFYLRKVVRGRRPYVTVTHLTQVRFSIDADVSVAVSQGMVERLISAGQSPERVVHIPPVAHLPLAPSPTPCAWRAPPVIGVLARLSEEKGVDVFLEALRLLAESGVRFRAIIGGDGPQRAALTRRIEETGASAYVELRGWITDKESFYRDIDVFCLPSRKEAFGLVLLEAAVRARPIVATDCDGARELFTASGQAVLVPRDDARALSNGLAALLRDEQTAVERAVQARGPIQQRYSMDLLCERVDALLAYATRVFSETTHARRSSPPGMRSHA